MVPGCRPAEVCTGLHIIRQQLHCGARRVGTQRQFLEEVFCCFIRWRQSIAIDGNALPLCHFALFLWHDGARALRGVQAMSWAQEPGGAEKRGATTGHPRRETATGRWLPRRVASVDSAELVPCLLA